MFKLIKCPFKFKEEKQSENVNVDKKVISLL